jgi:uncharacterized membrane protein
MVSPFDPRSVLLARHAQHVVLVHFPIALFLTAVAFDLAAQWKKNATLAAVARYNLLFAALISIPTLLTGILAWRWQLEGQRLKGTLLLHLIFGISSTGLIWLVWLIHRAGRKRGALPGYRLPVEIFAALVIGFTAHLGGFLSGVNSPG